MMGARNVPQKRSALVLLPTSTLQHYGNVLRLAGMSYHRLTATRQRQSNKNKAKSWAISVAFDWAKQKPQALHSNSEVLWRQNKLGFVRKQILEVEGKRFRFHERLIALRAAIGPRQRASVEQNKLQRTLAALSLHSLHTISTSTNTKQNY